MSDTEPTDARPLIDTRPPSETPPASVAQPSAVDPADRRGWRPRAGDWAVITGASEGIGRALARALAARGLHLVLSARRQERLDALAAELSSAHGVEIRVLAGDLTRDDTVERLVESSAALPVSLLVACAGFGSSGPFLRSDLESELSMVVLNCRTVVALCHPFGRRFADQGRGGIVLLSSVVAFQGVPRSASYAATKAFVQSFAEGLRGELRSRGITVLASAPGPVHSGFARRADMTMGLALEPDAVARGTLDALGRGSGTVRPGWLSKLLGWSLALLPRWGRVRVMTQVMRGMAGEGRSLPR